MRHLAISRQSLIFTQYKLYFSGNTSLKSFRLYPKKLRFIEGIQKAGAVVNDVLIVLDREQGCKEALEEKGIRLHKLITLAELLKYMKSKELVTAEKYKEILKTIINNAQ